MRARARLQGGATVELDDGVLEPFRERLVRLPPAPPLRLAFAAAHVVMRAGYEQAGHSPERPGRPEEIERWIDWEATLALRARLDRLGLGVAEAMDTAQRFEIGWPAAERLIRECGKLRPASGFIAGAGTDHLREGSSREDLVAGVAHQARIIQAAGGWPILLPMPWLVQSGAREEGYVATYREILARLDGPLFVHWLGEMFQPGLKGYFPGKSFERVMALEPAKVRGAKLSLLDAGREVSLRRELMARDQIVLTGDDLHFARLIRGGDPASGAPEAPFLVRRADIGRRRIALGDFSHALLGVLDAIAEPAALALDFLARGDAPACMRILEPCEELGQWLFQPPARHYKAGLAFLSWLNGLQESPLLPNRADLARSREHLVRAAELASACGAIAAATPAAERLEEHARLRES